jgi:hypothetical protein
MPAEVVLEALGVVLLVLELLGELVLVEELELGVLLATVED